MKRHRGAWLQANGKAYALEPPKGDTMESSINGASAPFAMRPGRRRSDWVSDGLVSGFAATFLFTVLVIAGYWVADWWGDPNGNQLERWFANLHENSITRSTQDSVVIAIGLNLAVGLFWALLYGADGEVRLSGPAWRKGMIYALGPWLLSILLFFPVMGAGIFGKDLGAGPLPVIGNLILHLAYGAALGVLYAVDLDSWLDGSEADHVHNEFAESGAAIGLVVGAPIGLIAAWLVGPSLDRIAGLPVIALLSTVLFSAIGLLVGSFVGIERGAKRWQNGRPAIDQPMMRPQG